MDAADGLPYFIVGGGGDGAGVENDEARVGWAGSGRKAFCGKAGFDSGAVGLRGSASEVFDEDSFHYVYVTGMGAPMILLQVFLVFWLGVRVGWIR